MHRRSKEFNIGEYVMVCIRPKRISKTFSKKLYARTMSLYSIIRKLRSNLLYDIENLIISFYLFYLLSFNFIILYSRAISIIRLDRLGRTFLKKHNIDYEQTFASVANMTTLRALIVVVSVCQ